jgi:hypothetical protein
VTPPPSDVTYWQRVKDYARQLGGDGCSGPTLQVHRSCCDEHDIHYRTGRTLDGQPITRAEADAEFRRCMQARSVGGRWHPLPWWRWVAVRLAGWRYFQGGSDHE